ncbi:hypothetical protein P153DRAFT_268784, partial [Dothidotthia symphoricarpi CBS 119687]
NRYHLSDIFVNFFTHMLAPTACVSCTCTTPCWAPDAPSAEQQCAASVDDECAIVEDESGLDGGPLCREATIASW